MVHVEIVWFGKSTSALATVLNAVSAQNVPTYGHAWRSHAIPIHNGAQREKMGKHDKAVLHE